MLSIFRRDRKGYIFFYKGYIFFYKGYIYSSIKGYINYPEP